MFAFVKYDIDDERRSLLGHWLGEGLALSFMLICLTGLRALVTVAWKALTPFVLCSIIAF